MMITPSFTYFKQSESLQYFNDAAELCKQSKSETLSTPLKNLTDINAKLAQAFKPDRGSDLTALLTEYDQRRDDAVVCISLTAQAFSNHFDPRKREAAANVLATINKYGKSLHRLNYQAETSVLLNLHADLLAAPLAADIEELHMTAVVAEMKESNSLFNDAFLNRVQESAADEQVAAGQLIQEAIVHYRTLVAHINAYNTINPSEQYSMLLKQLSELAAKYNSSTTSRATTKTEKLEF